MMFYFREPEMQKLIQFCRSPETKAMAVYGRRRAGKTRLLTEFMQRYGDGMSFLYFQCMSYDYHTCLSDFLSVAAGMFPDHRLLPGATTFHDAIDDIARSHPEPLCIIVDEFPFLARKREDAEAEFQWIIDHGLQDVKLILTGSNRSFMANRIRQYESPLYGRFDEIMEVRPFTFRQIAELFPDPEDAMQVFAMTGGVAQYVRFFQAYSSVGEAAAALFFRPDGRLVQEAPNLLLQELRDSTTYERILRALGSGRKTTAQIASQSGLDARGLSPYLNRLVDLDLIDTAVNPLASDKRNQRYRITDMLFRFHYTFIEPNMSMINAIREEAAEHILTTRYQEYLGMVYEDVIRDSCYRLAQEGRLPFMPQTVGSWWGNVCQDGVWSESEIDVLALDDRHVAVGECKYRGKQVGMKEYRNLQMKAAFIPAKGREICYLLASKSGFTDELKAARDPQLILIDMI